MGGNIHHKTYTKMNLPTNRSQSHKACWYADIAIMKPFDTSEKVIICVKKSTITSTTDIYEKFAIETDVQDVDIISGKCCYFYFTLKETQHP